MDSYQAIYDAVRSRISAGNVDEALQTAVRDMNLGHHAQMAGAAAQEAAYEYTRPSVVYKPVISIDGNQYCVLYGENLQEGCAGFGDSIKLAMFDFDKNWSKPL